MIILFYYIYNQHLPQAIEIIKTERNSLPMTAIHSQEPIVDSPQRLKGTKKKNNRRNNDINAVIIHFIF